MSSAPSLASLAISDVKPLAADLAPAQFSNRPPAHATRAEVAQRTNTGVLPLYHMRWLTQFLALTRKNAAILVCVPVLPVVVFVFDRLFRGVQRRQYILSSLITLAPTVAVLILLLVSSVVKNESSSVKCVECVCFC